MLFQPDSTFDSLRKNLNFLRLICEDGYMPVLFVKMRPYSETKIEKELRKASRIKGLPGFLDYDFIDKSLNDFHNFIFSSFDTWLNSREGLLYNSEWAPASYK